MQTLESAAQSGQFTGRLPPEKRNNVWRIVKRTAVYEKDRLEPVDPGGVPKDFFVDMDLSAFPASAKFLCYWLMRSGFSP